MQSEMIGATATMGTGQIGKFPANMAEFEYADATSNIAIVVDRDPLVRLAEKGLLICAGYEVFVADQGERACTLIKEHSREVDLIVVDDYSYFDVKSCLTENAYMQMRDVSLLLVTSGLVEENLSEVSTLLDATIRKPFNPREFLSAIGDMEQ